MERNIRAIDNLDDVTGIIKNELDNITEGFIAVGFYLKVAMQEELYKQKGYFSIFEYAKEVFGISRYTATRFMEINNKYSIGGNSPQIDDRWRGYGSSKLTEMLGLPEDIEQAVTVEATVKDIRQAKEIMRETEEKYSPQMELCDIAASEEKKEIPWLQKLVLELYREKEVFHKMIDWVRSDAVGDKQEIEENLMAMVNPSKFKMVRLDSANVLLQENKIRVMPYRDKGQQEEYSYIDLGTAFEEVFYPNYPDITAPIQKVYEDVYGVPLYEQKEAVQKKEKGASDLVSTRSGKETKSKKSEEKTARKEETIPKEPAKEPQMEESLPDEPAAEQIEGQLDIENDFPEICQEESRKEDVGPVRGAYKTRKEYLLSLPDEMAAEYMASCMEKKMRRMKNVSFSVLAEKEYWAEFLSTEVDEKGETIECAS